MLMQLSSSLPNASYFNFLKVDFFTWNPSELFDLILDYTWVGMNGGLVVHEKLYDHILMENLQVLLCHWTRHEVGLGTENSWFIETWWRAHNTNVSSNDLNSSLIFPTYFLFVYSCLHVKNTIIWYLIGHSTILPSFLFFSFLIPQSYLLFFSIAMSLEF